MHHKVSSIGILSWTGVLLVGICGAATSLAQDAATLRAIEKHFGGSATLSEAGADDPTGTPDAMVAFFTDAAPADASATARPIASHSESGGPQPFVGSVTASGKDTTLTRDERGASVSATEPVRKGPASSRSETTIRSTREPSCVVVIVGAVGSSDEPRAGRTAPIGSFVSTFENRSTAPAACRIVPQLKEAVVSDPSAIR